MMFILGMLLGAIIGMFIVALISVDRINELESLVRASRKSLRKAEDRVTERNKLIKTQREEIKEQRSKIVDLVNNIEILVNNLPEKLKEVITSDQTNQ